MAMTQLQDWKVDQDCYTNNSIKMADQDDTDQSNSITTDTVDRDSWTGSLIGRMQKIAQNGFARTNRIEPLNRVTINGSAKDGTKRTKLTESPSNSEKELVENTSEDVMTSTESLR
jgi:hypothetical protein